MWHIHYLCNIFLTMTITVKCHKEAKFPLLPEVTIKNENSKVVMRKIPVNGVFDKAGAKDGDVIKSVNETSFENISSQEVFRFLSSVEGDLTIVIDQAVKEEPTEEPIVNNKIKRKAMKKQMEESSKRNDSPKIVAGKAKFNPVRSKENLSLLKNPQPVEHKKKEEDMSKTVLLRENLILKKKIEKLNLDIGNFARTQEAINKQIEEIKVNASKSDQEREKKMEEMEENLKIKQRTIDQLIEDNNFLAAESSKYGDYVEEKTALENIVAEQVEENKKLKEEYRTQMDDTTLQIDTLRNIIDDIRLRTSAAEIKEKDLKKNYEEKVQRLLKELSALQQNYDDLVSKEELFNHESARNKKLETEKKMIENKCNLLKEKHTSEEQKNENLKLKIKEIEENLSNSSKKYEQEAEDMHTMISNLQQSFAKLETEKNNHICKLEQNVERLEHELEKERKIKDALSKEIQKMTNESKAHSDDKKIENQVEKEMIKMIEKENYKLKEQAERLNKKNADHQEELKNTLTANRDLKEKVSKFDDYIVEMTQFMRLINSSSIKNSTDQETVSKKRKTDDDLDLTYSRSKTERSSHDNSYEEKYTRRQEVKRISRNDPRISESRLKWRKLENSANNLDLEPIISPEKYAENDESSTSKAPVKFVVKSLSRTIGK